MLQAIALDAITCYVRHSPIELGKWRLALRSINWVRHLGPRMGKRMVRTKQGFRMLLYLNDWVDQHIFATGEFEPEVVAIVSSLIKPGSCAIDIGANVGYFSLLFAQLAGPFGKVIAFEPQPDVHARLLQNLSLNPRLTVSMRSEAVSDSQGYVAFYCGSDDHSGIASLRARADAAAVVNVTTARLDDILNFDNRIDLVKIDVEGAEHRVIDGMEYILDRWHPDLLVEVSDCYLREVGSSGKELCERLWARDYQMFRLQCNGLEPVQQWFDELPGQFNAFFTTRERLPSELKQLR